MVLSESPKYCWKNPRENGLQVKANSFIIMAVFFISRVKFSDYKYCISHDSETTNRLKKKKRWIGNNIWGKLNETEILYNISITFLRLRIPWNRERFHWSTRNQEPSSPRCGREPRKHFGKKKPQWRYKGEKVLSNVSWQIKTVLNFFFNKRNNNNIVTPVLNIKCYPLYGDSFFILFWFYFC